MNVGETIRRYRESRGLSLRWLAAQTGLTTGYLSRLETGQRLPTWRTLEVIGEAMKLQPGLHFTVVAEPDDAEELRRLSPGARLAQAHPEARWTLDEIVDEGFPFALTGAAAAVLHGKQLAVTHLQILVADDDAAIGQLIEALLKVFSLKVRISAGEFRTMNRGTAAWPWRAMDVGVTLVDRLPAVVMIDIGMNQAPVATMPWLLENDPTVAASVGTMPLPLPLPLPLPVPVPRPIQD